MNISKIKRATKWQNILLVIYIAATTHTADSAVNQYSFSSSQGIYSPIQGTILFTGAWDDSNTALLPLPFHFYFNGIDFDSLSVSSNGFITLGALTSTVYCGLRASGFNSIAAYGTDLMGNPGSTVQYGVSGLAPFQQFIIQWTDCSPYQSTVDHFNFQIILNQTSNVIQIIYGSFLVQTTMEENNCLAMPTESGNVGLKGSSATDLNIRSITNGVNDWNTSIAGSDLQAVCNLSPTNFPSEGTTYTWTPVEMHYAFNTTTMLNSGGKIIRNSVNNVIQKLKVGTMGQLNPLSINSFTFSTDGSQNPGYNLSEANIYMTGNKDTFSTANRFGFTVSDPDGIHVINGHAPLVEGINYFWLSYDIFPGANINDSITGSILSLIGNGTIGNQTVVFDSLQSYQHISTPTLCLKALFQSYYIGNTMMTPISDPANYPFIFDSVTVELHNAVHPFNIAYTTKSIVSTDGTGQFLFPDEVLSHNYYLVIRHRNSLETWSKYPVLFNSSIVYFDFTTP